MTIIERTPHRELVAVTFDLYRDIHKAIRSELFAVTTKSAGLDPSLDMARSDLASHVGDVVDFLVQHAEHEDGAISPVLEVELPDLAALVEADHQRLEARMEDLVAWSAEAAALDAPNPRQAVHRLHLELASFTAAYLEHQDVEERVVMPALEAAVGVPAVVAIHQAILAGIPPQEMGRSLALMLPAMNIDDRVEMLGGMRANAPAEVFEGVWNLAGSVLDGCDVAALAERLGVG